MAKENKFLIQMQKKEPDSPDVPKEKTPEIKNKFLAQIQNRPQAPEGVLKSGARTAAQVPLSALQRWTWPLSLLQLAGQGEAIGGLEELEERIPELMEKFPQAPWPENFSKEEFRKQYQEGLQQANQYFPSQQNAERIVEEKTGIPLQPKTALQKTIRLGGTAATFRPGGLAEKGTAAVVAPVAKKALEVAGVPEGLAEAGGLLASGLAPTAEVSKSVKPSGMPERRFESVSKPTKISPARHEKITESVEQDFRKISDQILQKNKTYSALKEDNLFKEKVSGLFDEVDKLAEQVEGAIYPSEIRASLRKKVAEHGEKGISPDEFERAYRKEIKRIMKETPLSDLTAQQGVAQFRKNNKALKEHYEPGKSSAFNRAKKQALLDYNKAIEEQFSKNYPDTQFEKTFKFTNKRWQEISDVEAAEGFIQDVFDGKINYSKAKEIFSKDKEHTSRPFKRLLGDDGFKAFKELTEDLLSSEKAYAQLKKASDQGYKDLAQLGTEYLIHPKIATTHILAKSGRRLYQMLLDKPKLAVEWKNALDNLKAGKLAEAQVQFKNLDELVKKEEE
jgi:hypothetical protein